MRVGTMPARLGVVAATALIVFGACNSSGYTAPAASSAAGGSAAPAGSAAAGAFPTAASSGNLEIFSYWTAGGEAQALAAVEKVFNQQYPSIKITNAVVAGGAGSNANAVLAQRMQANQPPDTFQIHGGAELIDNWVKTNYMQPLTALYQQQGWMSKFPKQLIDLVSYNGAPYAVPLDVHRNGVLWYNKSIFSKYNLQPPTSWNDFFTVADKLKAQGITPLALGDKDQWESLQLFEDILLSTLGPNDYRNIWTGNFPWTDPKVTQALQTMAKVVGYVNNDHATLTWDQADGLVMQGKAAMNIMGDWAKGYFESNGWKPNQDFGWSPAPGTSGDFIVVTDTFGMPKNIKDPGQTIAWLQTLGSVKAQEAFNPIKGSVCARLDCSPSVFDAYSQSSMQDFAKDQLVPSEANGPASIPAFLTPITTAIAQFVNDQNVANAQSAIASACKSSGACK